MEAIKRDGEITFVFCDLAVTWGGWGTSSEWVAQLIFWWRQVRGVIPVKDVSPWMG